MLLCIESILKYDNDKVSLENFPRFKNHCSTALIDKSHFLKFRNSESIKNEFVYDAQPLNIFRFTPAEVV